MSADSPNQTDPEGKQDESACYKPPIWLPLRDWFRGNVLNIILTGATVFLAIFAWMAWREAVQGTHIARQQLVAGDAAFVFIDGIDFVPDESSGKVTGWYVIPKWRNSGNTATKNLITWVNFGVLTMVPGFTKYDFATNGDTTRIFFDLGPHTNIPIAYFKIAPAAFDAGVKPPLPNSGLAIWGHATYSDTFPNTQPHITRFCFQVVGWRGSPTDVKSDFTPILSLCREGNCADDECKKKQ